MTTNKNWATAVALVGLTLLMASAASADTIPSTTPVPGGVINPNAQPLDPNAQPTAPVPGQTSGATVSNGSSFSPITPSSGAIYPPNIPTPYGDPPSGWNGQLQQKTGLDANGWVAVGAVGAQILTSNQPAVNTAMTSLSILPVTQPNWTQLAGWSMPIVKKFSFVYHGVTINYNIIWNANGSLNGAGQYIANLRASVSKMNVRWGYAFDAVTEAHDAINRGSPANPIAAIGYDVKFRVHTYFGEEQVTQSFFVSGDGQIAQIE